MLSPKEAHLAFDEWREGQVKAIEWLEESSEDDSWLPDKPEEREVKVLEAPTGTGKTGIVLGLAAKNKNLRFLVLCATKLEQEQYMKWLLPGSDVVSVKGKNNFHCKLKHPEMEGVEELCEEINCPLIHVNEAPCEIGAECQFGPRVDLGQDRSCFYLRQREEARRARVVVTNYAFGLSMLNYTNDESGYTAIGRFDVIVEDEGHVLDEELEKFISIKLSKRTVARHFSVSLPNFRGGGSIPQWKSWVEDSSQALSSARERFDGVRLEEMDKREVREALTISRYLGHFATIGRLDYDWVVEDSDRSPTIDFLPIWVTKDSDPVLFSHAKRHIIMSGTIPSAVELGKKVGLGAADFEFFRLPYTFPPENRPIILRPRVSLAFRDIDENLPLLVRAIDEILVEFRDRKGLIHTKSYKITDYLRRYSSFSDNFFTHRTENRTQVLEAFKEANPPAVLVSPSFDKAVDLPGDECEFIIIAKVPYPYLGSKVMKKRASSNRRYYLHETLMAMIQMAGRGVRSEIDICPTFVVDSLAPSFFKQVKNMTPTGIKEAIQQEL